MSTRVS